MSIFKSIRELEEVLEEEVSKLYGSPFIAHYDVPSELEETAFQELVEHVSGDFSKFLQLMPSFPCVCVRLIATALAESYGVGGSPKVYELISNRLNLDRPISHNYRRPFFNQFRRSCERIGLALPSANGPRMVSSYLFQAGVSQSQLSVLADTFLKAEHLLGLPHGDNTRDLDEWEDRVIDLAPSGLEVLRQIVKEDPTAYHAISFVRLRRRDYDESQISCFEREFLRAIERPSQSSSGGRESVNDCPILEFSDGELLVTIPQGAHRLEVKINGYSHPLSPGRQLGLPLPWPTTIEWKRSGIENNGWQLFQIFVDHQKIFVFSGDTGIYKGYLDPTASHEQSVRAGQLCLLSRTSFTVNEECSHRLGDDAFVLFCDISDEMVIRRHRQPFKIAVEARLRIDVVGEKVVRNRKGWLIAGAISVQIHGRGAESSELLEVRLQHPAVNGVRRHTVCRNSNGDQIANLEMPDNGDFGLARVSLHIRGQDRALYRTSFWYWPGLKRLSRERLFIARAIPENLAKKQLSHINLDSYGRLVLLEGEPYLRARLCFWVERRLINFSLPPPGASVSVRRSDGSERALKLGASLFVRDDYASSLIVRCSDPRAKIDLKGEIIPTAFGKMGMWCVSFAVLKQEGLHNRVRLLPDRGSKSSLDLVRVVPEAQPSSFRARSYDDMWVAEAEFERPIDAVQIQAENLISGEKLDADAAIASLSDHSDGLNLVTVIPTTSSSCLKIEIPQNNYTNGIWFVSLQVFEQGGMDWLSVINSSGESYATCISSNAFAQKLAAEDIADWCTEAQQAEAFLRLSRVIETPIARECRPNVTDLALNAWIQLGKSLATRPPSDQANLLSACALPTSIHAPETWIPVYHPLEVAPNLFAIPAEDIAVLASTEQSEYEGFELVGLAGITESLKDVVKALDISTTFLLCFSEFSELQRDPTASPGIFDFSRYCECARTIKQIADDDKPLSIWHHDRACRRMADRIDIAQRDRFSSSRLSEIYTIVHRFALSSHEGLDIPHDLSERYLLVEKTPRLIAALTQAWRKGDAEKLWDDLAFRVKLPMQKTRRLVGVILRLAPELLAFYLLLWVLVEKYESE